MMLPPFLKVAGSAFVALDFACERFYEERMVVEGVEEREQFFARAADIEGAPEVERIVVAELQQEMRVAAGDGFVCELVL